MFFGCDLISLHVCARYNEGNISTLIKFSENARYILAEFCYCIDYCLGQQQQNGLITLSPAKNGSLTFFSVDHTFFGEVVNFAETLQTICNRGRPE